MSHVNPSASQRRSGESWHIPSRKLHPRAGSAADKLVREQKRQAAQEELAKVRLEEGELENVLSFKYIGVMESR